jgi:hypothetical protein
MKSSFKDSEGPIHRAPRQSFKISQVKEPVNG